MRPAQAWLILGSRMRELREIAGISLTCTAQHSGWDKGHLSRVERGYTKPSAALVGWYDATFGACHALLQQFVELEAAVRQDRATTLRDARARLRRDPSEPAGTPGAGRGAQPPRMVAGGSVPLDFDPCDRSLFVSETIPDGTLLELGQGFEKRWTIRNAGPVCWRARWLTRQGAPGVAGWLQSPKQIRIPDTEPGQQVTIIVPMRAARSPGSAVAYFKMTDEAGRLYFPTTSTAPLHCTILVT